MHKTDRRRLRAAVVAVRTLGWAAAAALTLTAALGPADGVLAAAPDPPSDGWVVADGEGTVEPSTVPQPSTEPEPIAVPQPSTEPEPSAAPEPSSYPDLDSDPDPNDEIGGPDGVCGCANELPAVPPSSTEPDGEVLGAIGTPAVPALMPPSTDTAPSVTGALADDGRRILLLVLAGLIALALVGARDGRRGMTPRGDR